MEEIEKLRLRVEKDPNSRLFLPLAEEYRKSGMLDEAISVILRGLEQQPGYTSARVALGRIYLEKDMMDEARGEFEAVVHTIPDNLFAHRKLADIYRESGEIEKAITEYKTVIRLNPIDEEAKMCLKEVEGGGFPEESADLVEADLAEVAEPAVAEPLPDEEHEVMGEVATETEPVEALDEDFEAFSSSFSAEVGEELGSAEEVVEVPESQPSGIKDETSFDELMAEPLVAAEEFPDFSEAAASIKRTEVPTETAGVSDADAFIARGDFYRALGSYRGILDKDPENKQVLQRVAELKALLKLMGKGNEVLIARLEAFLDGIKRGFSKRP